MITTTKRIHIVIVSNVMRIMYTLNIWTQFNNYLGQFTCIVTLQIQFCEMEGATSSHQPFGCKTQPRAVSTQKRKAMVDKLCPLMPDNQTRFWKELHVNDSSKDQILHADWHFH